MQSDFWVPDFHPNEIPDYDRNAVYDVARQEEFSLFEIELRKAGLIAGPSTPKCG